MLKNYLKIAWRNLFRNRAYSTINILGLAIGMAVALMIGLWVADEYNVNKNFDHYDRVVQVLQNVTHDGAVETWRSAPIPLANALRTKYAADFKAVGIMSETGGHVLAFGDTRIGKEGNRYATPEMIGILSLKMIRGNAHALDGPASMIIDRSMAKALFGNTDPLDQLVKVDNKELSKVTGVFEDFPHGSQFDQTHYFESWATNLARNPDQKDAETRWEYSANGVFAQLQDNADMDKVSAKIKGLLKEHGPLPAEVILHPMSKWHLYDDFQNGKNTGGAIEFVKLFSLVGLFVLLLACINFMNLSTARSERRAREVGIRKAVGSLRLQLIAQFLGESLLITILALALAIGLCWLSLPAFNHVADKNISMPWGHPAFWLLITAFTLFTGLISGSYPAFYLSSFNAVKVLKGSFKAGRFASLPRKVLVVLQFTVSVALIIGTIVVFRQINFARNRPMGYDRMGLLTIYRSTPELLGHYDAIRQDLVAGGGIKDMALGTGPTVLLTGMARGFEWPGKDPDFKPLFGIMGVSQNFGNTVSWQFTQGRDFSPAFPSDSTGMVLTASVASEMKLKDPVGTPIRLNNRNYHVIGVIKDMVFGSPYQPIVPTVFTMGAASDMYWITLKLNPRIPTDKALALIGPVFRSYNPGSPFDYWFNEEKYAANFALDTRLGTLTTIFAVLAIVISCLGLFGLASFMAEQRSREIGIRKVLGATILNLWGLLSKEFLLLVSLSFVIALPLSYFYMHNYLQRYDYRTTISVWIFIGTMGMALGITLLTVSFQSIRASLANPVRSLRTE